MKRIAIITNIPSPYRVDLFCYLQSHTKEYELHIIYASHTEDNRKWEIDESRLENTWFLNSRTIKIKRRYDTKYIHISYGVRGLLKKLKPDIVVGSEYNPTILQAVSYCRRYRVPYISWTDGTLYSERNINKIQKCLRRYVIRRASAYLASSTKSREAQLFYGAREEASFISFLTVDIDKYLMEPKEREAGRLLYVGSLIERKGIDLLLRALQGIEENYTLALAGDGSEKEALEKLAESLGIAANIEFLGYLSQEKLRAEYARSSAFVLPTREDCFALVILEAMCAGLPVIVSKYADGVYDLVEDGKNGIVVDPFNQEKFRKSLQGILKDSKAAEEMGKASQTYVDRFRFERVSGGFWEAFRYVEKLSLAR